MKQQSRRFSRTILPTLFILIISLINQQARGQSCTEPTVTGTTFTTIADGNWSSSSVWSGGVAPGFNIGSNNKVVIMHDIDRNSSSDFFPANNSVLVIKNGGSLTTEQIQMENTSKIILNGGRLHVDHGNFQVKTSSASVCAYKACIVVDEDFQFEETGTNITFNNTGIQIDNGNLQSKATVSGSDIRIWLKNGNLERNGGTWSSSTISYRRVSGSIVGLSGIVAQSSVADITDQITPCDDITIEATNDDYTSSSVNGVIGDTNLGNILTNDLHNTVVATTSLVTISIAAAATPTYPGANVPTVNTTTGVVNVPANTPSGSYEIDYSICAIESGSPCDSAIVTVAVFNTIEALDNTYVVSAGGITTSILANDSLGNQVVIPASITTTSTTTVPTGFTLNADGTVSVASTVTSGTYSFDYQICENGAIPANCNDATVTLNVLNPIVANDNTYTVAAGDVTTSILVNDSLKDAPVNIADITTTATTAVPAGFTLNTDGTVSVASTVTSGTYSFDYQICENGATPANCSDATVTLNVLNPIVANDNTYAVAAGDVSTSILVNDSLKDAPVNVADITTTATTAVPAGFTLNTDGTVSVASTVTSGTYSFSYQICENSATPANCSDATVTLNVLNPIVANDNAYNTTAGSTTTSILTNDSLNGVPVAIEKITVNVTSTMPAGFTLNPDGTVSIESTVPFGSYNFDYEICEIGATPANCNAATVTIVLDDPLPVNMLYFNVKKDNNSALLEWATANETNNKGFGIERSQNGRDWSNIGFVETKAANGNSTAQLNYHSNDNKPFDGINYYRLKQQDVDGKFDYSVVKQLTFVADRIIKLYPNPAMDYVIIEGLDGTEELRLIDVSGRVLKTENAMATTAKIELNNVAAGSYQIQVISNGKLVSSHKVQKTQ